MVYPKISIIIPSKPGEEIITLNSIKRAEYPETNLEIFVAIGKQPAKQRNEAIKQSTGEVISFLDSDVVFEPDYFKKVAKHLESKSFKVVGGPAKTIRSDTFLQKCFGYVLGSYFGTQKMRAKFDSVGKLRKASEKELILCNLAIEKSVLDEYGLFNENLYPNEENELLNRISNKGVKFIYNPQLPVFRSRRKSVDRFARQLFNYGRGRAEHFLIELSFQPLFFIPAFFTIYLVSLIFYHSPLYLLPLFLYLGFDILSSLGIVFKKRSYKSILVTPFLFPITHISYGLGLIYGLVKIKRKKEDHPIRIIKRSKNGR